MKYYAVLMEKRKEDDAYLVTGNLKHFPMRTYVVTPREMLDIYRRKKINRTDIMILRRKIGKPVFFFFHKTGKGVSRWWQIE